MGNNPQARAATFKASSLVAAPDVSVVSHPDPLEATRSEAVSPLTLDVAPIDRRHRQLREIDAVDAADVKRNHLGAIGLKTAREHLDAAVDAELMPDRVLVEEVFFNIILAGAELKMLRRQEREMQALLGADRTIARRHHRQIGGAFETHQPAMAAAGVGPGLGHRSASPKGSDAV
jgi:hypothetical protein